MTTLGVMKARIADELARDDLAVQIERAIFDAIKALRRRRYDFTEGRLTSTTTAGLEYQPWPSGLLELDQLTVLQGSSPVTMIERSHRQMEEWAVTVGSGTGIPTEFANFGATVRFYPIPDAVYSLTWTGIVEQPALTSDASSNAWTDKAEMLTRQAAKALVYLDVIQNVAAARETAALVGLTPDDLTGAVTRRRSTGRIRAWG